MAARSNNLFLYWVLMNRHLLAVSVAASFAIGPVHANPDAIKAAFKKTFPTAEVKSVQPVPNTDMWEVFNGSELVYTDSAAKIFFPGPMIDLTTRANLTQQRLDKLLVVDFKALPHDQSLEIKRGKGTRKIAIFSDPRCGFCKRLDTDLAKLDDVIISIYPLPVLGPESREKARDIWCSEKPAATWLEFTLANKEPTKAEAKCDSGVLDKNIALAKQFGIRGTPAIIFEDGSRAAGALSMAAVEQRMAVPAVVTAFK